MPGARYAMKIVHPGWPALRVRYRNGVLVTPHGFPDWSLCARAVVRLPPPAAGLSVAETRIADVLAANLAMAQAATQPDGDHLWTPGGAVVATPPGWCWAHLGEDRAVALVPDDLHACFRHAGGVRILARTPGISGTGPRAVASVPLAVASVPVAPATGTPPTGNMVPDDVLDLLEQVLGWPLPERYREFVSRTNGCGPDRPAILGGHGLIADQPWFGVGREDRQRDLSFVATAFADRFTPDLMPIGYVQGGLLAVAVAGPDRDSVWYWDDDDPRDDDGFDAPYISANLLHRVADSVGGLFASFADPPVELVVVAERWVCDGDAHPVRDELIGAGLPARLQAPWQSPPEPGNDPLTAAVDLTT